jgi:hypothetical protein
VDYFLLPFRLDGLNRHVIWFQNDVDGVITTHNKRIVTFETQDDATNYAVGSNIALTPRVDENLELDWLVDGADFSTGDIDCRRTLLAWNFFADVAASLGAKASDFLAKDRKPSKTYDKVFWGNNLPAVTPDGEHYVPSWSTEEIEEIKSILVAGLMLFISNLQDVSYDLRITP